MDGDGFKSVLINFEIMISTIRKLILKQEEN